MKKIILIAIVSVLSGCYGAQIDQLKRQNAQLADQNQRLRQANADGYQPPGAPRLPSERPVPPAVGSPMMGMSMGQGATGAMWVRPRHGVYMGAVGAQPRQMTQGRKIQVTNVACDDNARDSGSNCSDRDGNGAPDYNTWMSFEIDGQPVVCDSGFVHPEMGVSLLLPEQSCFVEVGAARKVRLRVKLYRNNGTPWSWADLDTTPYASFTENITVANGIVSYRFDETYF